MQGNIVPLPGKQVYKNNVPGNPKWIKKRHCHNHTFKGIEKARLIKTTVQPAKICRDFNCIQCCPQQEHTQHAGVIKIIGHYRGYAVSGTINQAAVERIFKCDYFQYFHYPVPSTLSPASLAPDVMIAFYSCPKSTIHTD